MFVRRGNTCFTSCCGTNSVKQGGINLYMDDLSVELNCSGIGGNIGTSFINHLCYANDLCLISLSSSGMQHLLNICKGMHPHISYYIMDQSHCHYVSRKIPLRSVLCHFIWIR